MTLLEGSLLNLIGLLEVGITLFLLTSKFPPKHPSKWEFPLALALLFALTRIPLFLSVSDWAQALSFIALFFIYLLVCRSGRWELKLFWSVLAVVFLLTSVMVCNALFVLIFGMSRAEILGQPPFVQLQYMTFAKVVQGSVFYFLARKKTGEKMQISLSEILMLILIPLISMGIMIGLLEYSIRWADNEGTRAILLVCAIGLLVINLFTFVLYSKLSRQANRLIEQETLLQQNALRQAHFDEVNAVYDEILAWRHDFHNHLQAMKGLLATGDLDSIGQYLGTMESSIDKIEMIIQSGNKLVDAILNAKISRAKAIDIDVDVQVLLPSRLDMEATDLCSLMGNLMDNAIEACQRISSAEMRQFISMKVSAHKGQLSIEIQNSAKKVNRKNDRFLTLKESRYHGIGLRQIDSIVEKYKGYINRQFEDHVFETVVLLPVC